MFVSLRLNVFSKLPVPYSPSNAGRSPLYRMYNSQIVDHFYTTDYSEVANAQQINYVYEGIACSLRDSQVSGTQPLLRYWSQSAYDHFYTLHSSEISGNLKNFHYKYEGVTGYCSPQPGPNLVPLYRYYHEQNADHFYTTDENEIGTSGNGGYAYETVACYV